MTPRPVGGTGPSDPIEPHRPEDAGTEPNPPDVSAASERTASGPIAGLPGRGQPRTSQYEPSRFKPISAQPDTVEATAIRREARRFNRTPMELRTRVAYEVIEGTADWPAEQRAEPLGFIARYIDLLPNEEQEASALNPDGARVAIFNRLFDETQDWSSEHARAVLLSLVDSIPHLPKHFWLSTINRVFGRCEGMPNDVRSELVSQIASRRMNLGPNDAGVLIEKTLQEIQRAPRQDWRTAIDGLWSFASQQPADVRDVTRKDLIRISGHMEPELAAGFLCVLIARAQAEGKAERTALWSTIEQVMHRLPLQQQSTVAARLHKARSIPD
ncbi:hypothetical protein LJR230_003942 [Trinickia sp. LjRoot230]|uniref:hypothetical protein n=1 Tax=Trinickia sp. LjRoot230 TaxID=3342288 RepID=UPI003ECF67CF